MARLLRHLSFKSLRQIAVKATNYHQQSIEAARESAQRAGLSDRVTIVALQAKLEGAARHADEGYPKNEYLHIDKRGAMLKRLRRNPDPVGLRPFERLPKERMTPVGILDVLADTEKWLNWTSHFGPISGLKRAARSKKYHETSTLEDVANVIVRLPASA